jgi:hypothetical protein
MIRSLTVRFDSMMKCKQHLLSAACVYVGAFASLVIGSGQDASGGCFAASWNATASGEPIRCLNR